MTPRLRSAALTVLVLLVAGCDRGRVPPPPPTEAAAPATPVAPVYGKVRALCIGINDYLFPRIDKLTHAVGDADEVAKLFQERYGYQVDKLIGPAATKANILSKLDEYQQALGPDDALVIYFAGHGQVVARDSSERVGYLVPYDARLDLSNTADPDVWDRQALDLNAVGRRVEAMRALHVLVLLDACYSGYLGLGNRSSSAPQGDVRELILKRSRTVLAPGTEFQRAWEDPERGHGYFTYALLDQLKRQPATTASEVFLGLRDTVAQLSENRMSPQLRHLAGDGGEFVFLPRDVADVQQALVTINQRTLAARGGRTTLAELFEAKEAPNYRYAADAIEKEKDWKRKVRALRDNASLGDPLAMACLFQCYANGLGTDKDLEQAQRWAREAFDSGTPAGKHCLGRCYENGFGVPKNEAVGRKLVREAADAGFPLSQYQVAAEIEQKYLHTKQSVSEAERAQVLALLGKAADQGFVGATVALGKIHGYGFFGVPKDEAKGFTLLAEAVEKGDLHAHYALAKFCLEAKEMKRDPKECQGWMVKAAEGGVPAAQYWAACWYLGLKWEAGGDKIEKDFARGRAWAEMAAAQEYAPAYELLWAVHSEGLGGPKNLDLAVKYLEKGVAANHANSLLVQGLWYFDGTYYPKDVEKALRLWERAGALGSADAYYRLGEWYKWEAGKARSTKLGNFEWEDLYRKATVLLLKAARLGSEKAKTALLFEYLGPEFIRKEALEQLKKEDEAVQK